MATDVYLNICQPEIGVVLNLSVITFRVSKGVKLYRSIWGYQTVKM